MTSYARAGLPLLLGLLLALQLGEARGAASAAAESSDEIEEVEPVTVAAVPTPEKPGGILEIVGKLHPLFVHLPIGWLLLLFGVDGATYLGRRPWSQVGFPLIIAAAAVMVPTVVTGLLRASLLGGGADAHFMARVHLHRNLALVLTGLTVLALIVRTLRRNRLEGGWRAAYLILLACMAALLPIVGHLGGELVFGDDYLPL